MLSCVTVTVTSLSLHRAIFKCAIKTDVLLSVIVVYTQDGQLLQKYLGKTVTITVKTPPFS